MLRFVTIVFALGLVASGCRTGSSKSPDTKLLDDPLPKPSPGDAGEADFFPAEVRFSPVDDVEAGILAALSAMQASGDIAIYSFSDRDVLDKVKALAVSGKKIRLIINRGVSCGDKCEELEEAGVDVRFVNRVMHHKFAIIDGNQAGSPDHQVHQVHQVHTVVITGSANWSYSAFHKFDEDWLRFESQWAVSQAFQREFNLLWGHSRDFPGPATSENNIAVTGEPLTDDILFTSSNMEKNPNPGSFGTVEGSKVVTERIVALFDAASMSIDVAQAHFRTPEFFAALKRAHERGVRVRVLLDQQEFRPEAADDADSTLYFEETLAQLGIEVRYKVYSLEWDYRTAKQLHTKFSIVDGDIVLTGSYNWSLNSETRTFENMLILRDDASVQEYQDRFAVLFTRRHDSYDETIQDIIDNGRTGPCSMEPIAMTVQELIDYRATFVEGACG